MSNSESVTRDAQRLDQVYRRRYRGEQIAARYSLADPANRLLIEQRNKEIRRMLAEHGIDRLNEKRVLEVGCGSGGVLAEWRELGVGSDNLTGIELLDWRLAEAQDQEIQAHLVNGNGAHLPFADDTFDLTLQFTVFTSVTSSAVKRQIASEMSRVTRPSAADWSRQRCSTPTIWG